MIAYNTHVYCYIWLYLYNILYMWAHTYSTWFYVHTHYIHIHTYMYLYVHMCICMYVHMYMYIYSESFHLGRVFWAFHLGLDTLQEYAYEKLNVFPSAVINCLHINWCWHRSGLDLMIMLLRFHRNRSLSYIDGTI